MDEKQEFINAYEKEYKKTNRILLGIIILGIGFLMCAKIIFAIYRLDERYKDVILGIYCFLICFFIIYRGVRNSKNVDKIISKFKKDLNVDFALSVLQKLLENKSRLDYLEILYVYLDLLFQTGRFDMFEEVYKKNRTIMKLLHMKRPLMNFITKYLSLSEDRSKYKKWLYKYRFTRWHNAKGKLSGIRKLKRFRDESFEVLQFYEAGEYQKAIEKIEQMHIDNPWDQMRFQAEKQKCLYHLKEGYTLPKEEDLTFLFVRRWKTLVETGKEYTYEQADKMLSIIKKDLKSFYGVVVAACLSVILSLLFNLVFVQTLSRKDLLEKYVKNVESWDIEVSEARAFCENNDMAAAVIYAKSSDNEDPKQYYLANVDYFTEKFVPMLRLDIQRIYDVTDTNVYIAEGDYSTYIAVVTEKPSEIIYDDKRIEDVRESRLPSSSLIDIPYLYSFMIGEEYDENLLKIRDL